MRKILFTAFLASMLFVQFAFTQSDKAKNALSYSLSFIDYYSPSVGDLLMPDGNITAGAKLAYHRQLAGPLNVEIPLRVGVANLPTINANGAVAIGSKKVLAGLDALLQLQLAKGSSPFIPYLSAGAGFSQIAGEDLDLQVPLGLGLDLRIVRNFYLQGRSEYRLSFQDYPESGIEGTRNNLMHHIGVKVLLGTEEEPQPQEEPDTDGDGISDLLDKCPTEIGTAAMNGCPDTDSDGIADKDDSCPKIAGTAAMNGCPDTDGDGLADNLDKCPNEAGPRDNEGCPLADTDGDGVADENDDCPTEAGIAAMNGCPDTDGDGLADKDDNCPTEAGTAALKGCPDSDNDGVPNASDKCPNEAGPAKNDGCPIKEIKAEDKETLERVAKDVQFESNSSYFKPASLAKMDEIAKILKEYPGYMVRIEGHTDSAGEDNYNQMLSEKRAKRCYDYLVDNGIDAARMTHGGYGETQPIATNSTAAGRKINRRVTFTMFPKS